MTEEIGLFEVQTRNDDGETLQHPNVVAAFEHADNHDDVCKISWTVHETGERVRLVRAGPGSVCWRFEPIRLDDIKK